MKRSILNEKNLIRLGITAILWEITVWAFWPFCVLALNMAIVDYWAQELFEVSISSKAPLAEAIKWFLVFCNAPFMLDLWTKGRFSGRKEFMRKVREGEDF